MKSKSEFKKLSRGISKYIRLRKAFIRRSFPSFAEQKKAIENLTKQFFPND